jgi:hypothetical protein
MSDGYCDMAIGGDYDGDAAAFYVEKVVKARKPHVCDECRESIAVGATYRRVVGKWGDELSTYRFCGPCDEICQEFSDGARSFGVLWDEIEINWNDGAHLQACLNRLTTVTAKAHMHRQWMKWKGLA